MISTGKRHRTKTGAMDTSTRAEDDWDPRRVTSAQAMGLFPTIRGRTDVAECSEENELRDGPARRGRRVVIVRGRGTSRYNR